MGGIDPSSSVHEVISGDTGRRLTHAGSYHPPFFWARTDGVHALPIPRAIIPIVLVIGWWSWAEEVRGQGVPPDASRPAEPDPGKTEVAEPNRPPELARIGQELQDLGQAQAQAKAASGPEIDRLKAQVDLQQKQIDVLLRMTQLLADQAKKQPATGAAVEKLQEQVATQEARILQGAQRDQELAKSRDDLLEQVDALTRTDPVLPSTLRELFLPTRNNESPLAIYGMLSQDFTAFSKQNSTFIPPTLQLHPYMLLNERWMMSANIILLGSSLQICRMQAEWFINDSLTFVAGRFYSPIGFYTERHSAGLGTQDSRQSADVQPGVPEPTVFRRLAIARGEVPLRLAREDGIRRVRGQRAVGCRQQPIAEGLLRPQQFHGLDRRREWCQGLGRPTRPVDPESRLHRGDLRPGEPGLRRRRITT